MNEIVNIKLWLLCALVFATALFFFLLVFYIMHIVPELKRTVQWYKGLYEQQLRKMDSTKKSYF